VIREITVEDLPWGLTLALKRYTGGDFDLFGGLGAVLQAIKLDTALAVRNEHGFLIGNITTTMWTPKRRTLHLLMLCVEEGHHWSAIELLRGSIEWARKRGCRRWLFNSDTDHRVDALAFRVGAQRAAVYEVNFAEGG